MGQVLKVLLENGDSIRTRCLRGPGEVGGRWGSWGQPVNGVGSLHAKKALICWPRGGLARFQAD